MTLQREKWVIFQETTSNGSIKVKFTGYEADKWHPIFMQKSYIFQDNSNTVLFCSDYSISVVARVLGWFTEILWKDIINPTTGQRRSSCGDLTFHFLLQRTNSLFNLPVPTTGRALWLQALWLTKDSKVVFQMVVNLLFLNVRIIWMKCGISICN